LNRSTAGGVPVSRKSANPLPSFYHLYYYLHPSIHPSFVGKRR
jgi:hypothetical protein